ncbi:hypothetical protein [Emticicia sp. BO119]|uniref:hypothetical protein n=1 Tax=Emticicia sp. BO119 TaxID=2757768 RepID=UPI0015F09901|nr:hypothetical protein [Emticicia sp. BO119]MBA4848988.1 hypothetical protein [Emticicia sp. BO119]
MEEEKPKKNRRGLKALLGIALGIVVVTSLRSKKTASGSIKHHEEYDPEKEIGL